MVITHSKTSGVLDEPANNKHHQNETTPPSPLATGKRTQDGRQIDGEPHDGALGESWCSGLQIRLEQDGVASLGNLVLGGLEVGDEGIHQAGGDLLLPPIGYHNQITPAINKITK